MCLAGSSSPVPRRMRLAVISRSAFFYGNRRKLRAFERRFIVKFFHARMLARVDLQKNEYPQEDFLDTNSRYSPEKFADLKKVERSGK